MTEEADEPTAESIAAYLRKMSGYAPIEKWRAKYPDPSPIVAEIIAWQAENFAYASGDPGEVARLEASFENDELALAAAHSVTQRDLTPHEFFQIADIGRLVGDRPSSEWSSAACAALARIGQRIRAKTLVVPSAIVEKYPHWVPMPMEYIYASRDFDNFVEILRQALDHTTRHQTYQTIESVLRVFRRRLDVRDALIFADALPPVLRAIFVASWDLDEPKRPFDTIENMNREVQEFRKDHDFSPDTAIQDVARILRSAVDDGMQFELTLAKLPAGAQAFWVYPRP